MDPESGFIDLTATEKDAVNTYSDVELLFMPRKTFFRKAQNIFFRKHAVALICKLSRRIDPDTLIPYLAMNYFDRFFSKHDSILAEVEGFVDTEKVRLIALACLTISAKMRIKDFSIDQFLITYYRDVNVRISHQMVMRTELLILRELEWEIRSVTPLTFLDFYYRYFKAYGGFKRRCINEIIVQAQGEHTFVHYYPTMIAISAFLAASRIAYPAKYREIALPFTINRVCPNILQDKVTVCVEEMVLLCNRLNIRIETPRSGIPNEGQQNRAAMVTVVDPSEDDDEGSETSLMRRNREIIEMTEEEERTSLMMRRRGIYMMTDEGEGTSLMRRSRSLDMNMMTDEREWTSIMRRRLDKNMMTDEGEGTSLMRRSRDMTDEGEGTSLMRRSLDKNMMTDEGEGTSLMRRSRDMNMMTDEGEGTSLMRRSLDKNVMTDEGEGTSLMRRSRDMNMMTAEGEGTSLMRRSRDMNLMTNTSQALKISDGVEEENKKQAKDNEKAEDTAETSDPGYKDRVEEENKKQAKDNEKAEDTAETSDRGYKDRVEEENKKQAKDNEKAEDTAETSDRGYKDRVEEENKKQAKDNEKAEDTAETSDRGYKDRVEEENKKQARDNEKAEDTAETSDRGYKDRVEKENKKQAKDNEKAEDTAETSDRGYKDRVEEGNKKQAKDNEKAEDTAETSDRGYKDRVEAIIRQGSVKCKAVGERMQEYIAEIAELEERKSLMNFELKWPEDVPTEPESPTANRSNSIRRRAGKLLTCGSCKTG